MLAIQKNCCILAFEVNPCGGRPNPGKHGSVIGETGSVNASPESGSRLRDCDWSWLNFERRGARGRMSKFQTATGLIVCTLFCLNVSVAQAGPCSADIVQFEKAIRDSMGNPNAGLTAPQSVGAQIDRQPTPESIKKAQDRLREKFSAIMARAKRLDARGNRSGCTSALSAAKRMYIL